ncbi:PfkB family carbohydrate kinase [Brenneria uluponensis]|uniref:PfkB family carbohydrate kinase n=1 Tax=Brenneria uluponensis TaxID=3057057 RepID=UPI0028E5A8FA|nr:PfkB family carbohydrate kinase [Brenneria ulupoensis]
MFVEERRKKIFNTLRSQGQATVTSLARQYGVTKETIRSDLTQLEESGLVQRCHGGAMIVEHVIKPLSWQTMGLNVSALMQELVSKNQDFLYKDKGHPVSGKVCVLGSFSVDIIAVVDHFPLEGELLMAKENRFGPGGKGANQALAASRAGGNVHFIAKVGCDHFSTYAHDHLVSSGINSFTLYQSSTVPTGSAMTYFSQETHSNITAVYLGANITITQEEIDAVLLYLRDTDILLIQGEINVEAQLKAVKFAHSVGTQIIFNPAPYSNEAKMIYPYVDYIIPNKIEAQKWSGIEISDLASAKKAMKNIAGPEKKKVILNLGKKGCLVFDGSIFQHLPALPSVMVDAMGAGDAFNGSLAAELAKGSQLIDAVNYALAFTAVFVEHEGVSNMPTHEKVTRRLEMHHGN